MWCMHAYIGGDRETVSVSGRPASFTAGRHSPLRVSFVTTCIYHIRFSQSADHVCFAKEYVLLTEHVSNCLNERKNEVFLYLLHVAQDRVPVVHISSATESTACFTIPSVQRSCAGIYSRSRVGHLSGLWCQHAFQSHTHCLTLLRYSEAVT